MDGQVLGWDHGACVVDQGDGREGEAVIDRGVRVRSDVLLDMEPIVNILHTSSAIWLMVPTC
jgi:hypothetical protein